MIMHKALGLLAAGLVTVGQALVLAADTSATTDDQNARGGYEFTLDAGAAAAARISGQTADQRLVG